VSESNILVKTIMSNYETYIEFNNQPCHMVVYPSYKNSIVISIHTNAKRIYLKFGKYFKTHIFDTRIITDNPDIEDEARPSVELINEIVKVLIENKLIQHVRQTKYKLAKLLILKIL
jgi:hypothetical protein